MQIQVRVINQASGQIKQIQGALQSLDTTMARSNATAGSFGRSMDRMPLEKWGKNLQWTGRQIEYNFTLPLALAGGAAMKWAMQNETAMVRIQKVYGNTSTTQQQMLSDTKALGRAFEALSNIYGVQQSEVLNIAADWAQAGASGAALAKQVRLTMDTMVLGEMDATKATQALISIQSQYGLSTGQAIKTIAMLNMVENQTAISMQGLIDGFQRAAGSARAAGVDTRHLAALLAAMVPATGSAAQAGNGLRTMLSRLLAPTKAAADLLGQLGININTSSWQSKNGAQRLIELATAYEKLTGGQQAVVSSTIASRYQINRFDILMRDILNPIGEYQRALQSTSSDTKVMAQYHRELGQVLSSQPQAIKILYTQLQNAMSRIIIPLLPAITALIDKIVGMVNWFTQLNPHLQEFILAGVGIIAVVGPIIRYIGATTLLFTELGKGAMSAARAFGLVSVSEELADGSTKTYYNGLGKLVRFLAKFPGYIFSALVTPLGDVFAGMGKAMLAGLSGLFDIVVGWGRSLVILMGQIWQPVLDEALAWLTAMDTAVLTWLTALDTAVIDGFKAFLAAPLATLAALDEAFITGLTTAFTTTVAWLTALDATVIDGLKVWFAETIAFLAALDEAFIAGLSAAFTTTVEWLAALDTAVIAGMKAFYEAPLAMLAALDEMFIAGLKRMWIFVVELFEGGMTGILTVMRTGFKALSRLALEIIPEMFGPWGIAVLAVLALVTAFSGQIKTVFQDIGNFIMRVFNALPQGIQNAFIAVISVVRSAVETIVGWMKELNPFQRHSPSLVDNVQAGHKVIAKNYHQMSKTVAGHAASAADALRDFNGATAGARQGFEDTQFAGVRSQIVQAAPNAGPAFDKLVVSIKALESTLPNLTKQITEQTAVVARWQKVLDVANAKLDTANAKLKALQATADTAKAKLDADQQALSNFANTPIQGMKAMGDQIFANTIAQKKLQLQIMQMEDATGPIDKLQQKMADLQGNIEQLRGEQASLRQGGAGSEITGAYDQQIQQLQSQQKTIEAQAAPIQALTDQLAALQRQGQELDLQNSIQFDPLTKQIQDMTTAMKEMPFDKIVAGINQTQAAVAKDQTSYDAATAAVAKQQKVVDQLTLARDKVQKSYDAENAKLQAVQKQYDANTQAIQNMKSAMDDFTQSASAAAAASSKSKQSALDKQFAGAAAGSIPKVGGKGIDFTGGGDINKLADQWIQESKKAFGNFDIFAPIKDMFKKAWDWVNEHTGGFANAAVKGMRSHISAALIGAGIGALVGESLLGPFGLVLGAGLGAVVGNAFAKLNWGNLTKSISGGMSGIGKSISGSGIGTAIGGLVKIVDKGFQDIEKVYNFFKDDLSNLGHEIWNFISGLVTTIMKEFHKWDDLWKPLGEAFGHILHFAEGLFKALYTLFKIGMAPILVYWKALFPILINVLKPAFDLIIGIVKVAIDLLHDTIKFVLDLINGDWSKAFGDLGHVALDILTAIYDVFKAIFGEVYGIVKGLVTDIVRFFTWLYDELWGHSILRDIYNAFVTVWHGIGDLIRWVWDHMIKPVFDLFKIIWQTELKVAMDLLSGNFKKIWHDIGQGLQDVWNKVIMPIWHGFMDVWHLIEKPIGGLVSGLKSAWSDIGQGLKVVNDKVIQPIWNGLKAVWNFLKPGFQTMVNGMYAIWNGIGSAIAAGINIGIDAINHLIGGLNWIGSHVPGLKFHIETIGRFNYRALTPPKLAEGGYLATGGGFRTHGARAIVGEGNPAHPEYVIPTDPKYRANAMRLIHGLLADMHGGRGGGSNAGQTGAHQPVQFLAGGGLLGGLESAASGAWNIAKGAEKWIRKGAVMAAMAPFLKAFDAAASHIPNGLHERDFVMAEKNKIYNWMKGEDGKKRANPDYVAPPSPMPGMSQAIPTNPNVVQWMDTTSQVLIEMQRSIQYIPVVLRRIELESGGNQTAVNRTDINWQNGTPSVGLMQVIKGTFDTYAGKYHGVGPYMYGVSTNPKANIWAALHYAEKEYGNIANIDPLTHPGGYASGGILGVPSLADGAYIKRRTGGILVRVGEGQHDEIVKPLPRGINNEKSGDIHFHGDLSFPNIKNGDDAEKFIDNLKVLAKR